MTNLLHSPTCFRKFIIVINHDTKRVYAQATWRERWECPACSAKKLADITKHLVSRCDTLCWGPYSHSKRQNALRKGIGFLSIGYKDDVRIMVAGSYLYEPVLPSEKVVAQLIEHTLERKVTKIGWSDNWRPSNDNPQTVSVIDAKCDDLARVNAAIKRAGCIDGKFGDKSALEVKSNLEQILYGSTFNSD